MTEELRNEGLDVADHVHEWSDGCKVVSAGKSWRLECCECGANRIKAGSMDSESPYSTPEMDAAAYEATTRTVGKWIVPIAKARKMEADRDHWRNEHDRVVRKYQHRLMELATSAITASHYPENAEPTHPESKQ